MPLEQLGRGAVLGVLRQQDLAVFERVVGAPVLVVLAECSAHREPVTGPDGRVPRERDLAVWRAEFEREIGPLSRFGTVIAAEAAWLDTWLVCHAAVIDGRTPIDATRAPLPIDERLRQGSIGGWWVRGSEFPAAATPWREESSLTLHCAHEPLGALVEGALLIARGIDVGAGQVALVGRPVIVDEQAVSDILGLLHRAPERELCAGLRWPEVRTHTAAGEIVRQRFRHYSAARRRRRCGRPAPAPTASRSELLTYWDDDVVFKVLGAAVEAAVKPPDEPGVIWEQCDEDAGDPPLLGELTISPEEGEVSLSAPSEGHMERLVAVLPASLLGERESDNVDLPDVLPRVRRERLEGMLRAGLPCGVAARALRSPATFTPAAPPLHR